MKSVLFATKSLEQLTQEASSESSGLKRVLGPWHLIFLGVGAIVGAGIFVMTGHVAAQYSGPAVTLSIVLAGLTCAFAGLCYAEFASMIPIAGSAYTYGYATLGELGAWIIGWDLILEYLFAASTVAVGWSGYVVSFLKVVGITIPAQFTSAPYVHTVGPGADLIHGRARCQGCAVPLRHHALIVIGIDGIGDHAALRALEFLGGHVLARGAVTPRGALHEDAVLVA